MTEAEWLACTDPRRMLPLRLPGGFSYRKFRLFCCAYCRFYFWPVLPPALQDAVATAEDYADGSATKYRLRKAQDSFLRVEIKTGAAERGFYAAQHAVAATDPSVSAAVLITHKNTRPWRGRNDAAIAGLVRDVFGNPFRPAAIGPPHLSTGDGSGRITPSGVRPAAIDPAHLSVTAVTLARQMYESRDFAALPILADALQDAGCDDADVLAHCRAGGRHVRGCWALDLVLGKS